MADSWADVINWLAKTYAGGNLTRLAKMLSRVGTQEFKRQNLEGWIGGSMPTLPAVQAVLKTFPELRPEWVATGERPRERVSGEATEAAKATAADARARLIALADQISEDYGLDNGGSGPTDMVEPGAGESTGGPEGDTVGMQGAIDAARRAAKAAERNNRRRA